MSIFDGVMKKISSHIDSTNYCFISQNQPPTLILQQEYLDVHGT